MHIKKVAANPVFHFLAIALLGVLVYSNSFDVPFQFDDEGYMIDNPVMKDFDYFLDPSLVDAADINKDFKLYFNTRYVAYLSFWINYKLAGRDVTGYHVANLAIHIINALLVYLLVSLTFKSPALSTSTLRNSAGVIALCSGLLFVAHPVQTMAITYILQRWASLAAMFYLLSLVFYGTWRLRTMKGRTVSKMELHRVDAVTVIVYLLSLLSAVFAMKTKEIAFTLPLMMGLYELMFFEGRIRRRLRYLIPFFATMLIIPYAYLNMNMDAQSLSANLSESTQRWGAPSRLDYLFSEFRAIVTYIRLLFLPIAQSIYYDNMVFHSFSEPPVFLSFLFLLFMVCVGGWMFLLSRKGAPALRLVSFGIFWFFLALSVESSVLPIMDTIAEYRVYLPSAGMFMAVASGVALVSVRFRSFQKNIVLASVAAIIIFSFATYERNTVWRSEIGLWEDTVKKAPDHPYGYLKLGVAYRSKGMSYMALDNFLEYLRLITCSLSVRVAIGDTYKDLGMTDKAIEYYRAVISRAHYASPEERRLFVSEAHYELGVIYQSQGDVDSALDKYKAALRLNPDHAEARSGIAEINRTRGMGD